jgi:hypothetical protein
MTPSSNTTNTPQPTFTVHPQVLAVLRPPEVHALFPEVERAFLSALQGELDVVTELLTELAGDHPEQRLSTNAVRTVLSLRGFHMCA